MLLPRHTSFRGVYDLAEKPADRTGQHFCRVPVTQLGCFHRVWAGLMARQTVDADAEE